MLFELRRNDVLDEDVGAGEELEEHVASLLASEVQAHAALVAVDREEPGGLTVEERRAPSPGIITPKRLDLDDARAPGGQIHRCGRRRVRRRDVDHTHPPEWSRVAHG